MAMDMLEHEQFVSNSSIAARGSSTFLTLGDDGTTEELEQSFLVKRMEIQFTAIPRIVTDDASSVMGTFAYALVFTKTSVDNDFDTIAEQLDSRMTDLVAHQALIWYRPYTVTVGLIDDADNIVHIGVPAVFSTSKSFSKGFRIDKDETYLWATFNPASSSQDALNNTGLRVRYWGVYING